MKKIAIATGTRADWELLSPLARLLKDSEAEVVVMATNMHLMEMFGMTVNRILEDGFPDPIRIPAEGTPAQIAASALSGFADAFRDVRPDCVVILGDRFEMGGVALAATIGGIPIVHIAGGTVSEGAIDDAIRHSITKQTTLHFVETDACRRRVIRMGEDPEAVITTGAIGVWNVLNVPLLSRQALEESLGHALPRHFFVGTLHAETRAPLSAEQQMAAFISAIESVVSTHPDTGAILTYPNNDVDPRPQIRLMDEFAGRYPDQVLVVPSLGLKRYLSAAALSCGVIGNSSSGIVEIPSLKIPVVNIGARQTGREVSEAVIHCGFDPAAIREALLLAMSDKGKERAASIPNPYFRPDTPLIMSRRILATEFRPYPEKKFHCL